MKTIGIVAHSVEGASLCYLTACHEGARHLGLHMHPTIVMSSVPMALSMPGWQSNDYAAVARGFGIAARRADSAADLATAMKGILASGAPGLVDARIDPSDNAWTHPLLVPAPRP